MGKTTGNATANRSRSMSRREDGGEEMADQPEAAIQAILIGILNMQQLNLS